MRITEAAKESGTDVPHEKLSKQITIKEAGYVYIYLSNDNLALGGGQIEVYFDDFKVEHVKSPVIASQDYYPFGLTFNNYQKENSLKNLYLYNKGAERQDELDLNVDATKYRVYDPAIDRWWQVDPLADQGDLVDWTPYNYGFNNPVRYNDPEGDCPVCAIPIIVGGASIAEAAAAAGIGTAIVVIAKTYGKQILNAMGNASPYSTPAVDAAQSLGGTRSLNSSGKSQAQNQTSTQSQASTSNSSSAPTDPKDKKDNKNEPVTITVSKSKYPQAAQHIEEAEKNGVSTTGTIDRAGAAARRKEALKGVSTQPGKDRDEVPPAVINNGGNGSSVKHIDYSDNRGAGSSIGWQIQGLPNGTNVTLKTSN